MVMVDHDLSEGVISSLYPENSDTIRGINPSTTKVFPQEALHKMIPKEEPRISIVNLNLPIKEGMEPVNSEPEPCLGQFTMNKPKEEFQTSPMTPSSHSLKQVVIQEYFSRDNRVSPILEEKENPRINETVLPEQEGRSLDLPIRWGATLKEAQPEANLPNLTEEVLSLPMVPWTAWKKTHLRSSQRKRMKKRLNEATTQIGNLEKQDILLWWENEEVAWQLGKNAKYSAGLS